MTTINRMQPSLSVSTTQPRQTGPSAGDRFRESLGNAAIGVLGAVEATTGIPTGSGAMTASLRTGQNSAAISGSGGTGNSGIGSGPTTGSSLGLSDQGNQALELLEMQQAISAEQRQFQTVSNVMKARHDTAKAVIQNVR